MSTQAKPRRDLIACPQCDGVYVLQTPNKGERAVCARCHSSLITPRSNAGLHIIVVSLTVVILTIFATVFPFLTVKAAGVQNSISILDAVYSFSDGWMFVLSISTATVIIFIPLLRALSAIYVLLPVVFDFAPAKHARPVFRISESLRPWSMAEIFAIGCAVALIKISDLANISFGPAFWMFSVLVILVVIQDTFMCRWSVWNSLDQ